MTRDRSNDRGVTIVEAAFALPILLLFVMGLIDLGLWTLNDNQATNAARDGARGGVISYLQADVPGSSDHDAIVDEIESHLPGRSIAPGDIDVRCIEPDGTPRACAVARPHVDRLEVSVDWTWTLITPIAAVIGVDEGEAKGVAAMTLIGKPVAGTPVVPPPVEPPSPPPPSDPPTDPTPCSITGITVSPSPVKEKGNGQLKTPITIRYTTNQVEQCNALAVQLTTPGGTTVSALCVHCENVANHEWTYSSNKKDWSQHGNATVTVFNEFIEATGSFVVAGG